MKYILKIFRGDKTKQYFEEFELEYEEGSNVISALNQIRKNPINIKKQKVTPISYEASCLEEVCGACSILINGYPRQACSALIKPLIEKRKKIILAPLSKFYVIRDLVIDRSKMFEQLKKIKAWIEAEVNLENFGVKIKPSIRDALYILSKCMTCGCCLEACPQYNAHSPFIGPAILSQIDLFNRHPLNKTNKRLEILLQKGGIADCSNAQNCLEVCPKRLPLSESIARLGKEANLYFFKNR